MRGPRIPTRTTPHPSGRWPNGGPTPSTPEDPAGRAAPATAPAPAGPLFHGRNTVLDVNDPAEQFSRRQRRALAARDGHCVFPSCTRPPRFCDAHHLHHREHGGPTRTDNAALLCRFHHRLVHEHGWTVTVQDDHWTATDRHGTTWTGRPTPVRPARPPDRLRSPADQSAR